MFLPNPPEPQNSSFLICLPLTLPEPFSCQYYSKILDLKLSNNVWYNVYMSILIKKIGNKSYAYFVNREGKRVVHKYVGSIEDPKVEKMILDKKEITAVPERFRSLFWDTNLENIHVKRNARYIIKRVIEIGTLDAFNWLQRGYTVQNILDVINTGRDISEKSRNFWKLWLGAEDA